MKKCTSWKRKFVGMRCCFNITFVMKVNHFFVTNHEEILITKSQTVIFSIFIDIPIKFVLKVYESVHMCLFDIALSIAETLVRHNLI